MTINSVIPYWTPTPPAEAEHRLRDSLSVLATRHQRAVLRVLAESGRSLSTAELVTRLAAHPRRLPRDRLAALLCADESRRITHSDPDSPPIGPSIPPVRPPTAAVAAMVDALHHVHLPILEAAALVDYDPETGTVAARSSPASDKLSLPTAVPTVADTPQYPVDWAADGVVVRLVVSPDGHVDDAYGFAVEASTVRTVAVPICPPTTHDPALSATASTNNSAGATQPPASTIRRREQWLIDCWLRHSSAA